MSYTNLVTHAVFGTRERFPFLADPAQRAEVHAYLGGIVRTLKGTALNVNGAADHVHMLIALPATIAMADAMREIKSISSGWIHGEWRGLAKFHWQSKYAAFSVSRSNVPAVARYIDNQEKHHGRHSFEEELIELLDRHGISYDPRYLWQ
jgi:putative transposase